MFIKFEENDITDILSQNARRKLLSNDLSIYCRSRPFNNDRLSATGVDRFYCQFMDTFTRVPISSHSRDAQTS